MTEKLKQRGRSLPKSPRKPTGAAAVKHLPLQQVAEGVRAQMSTARALRKAITGKGKRSLVALKGKASAHLPPHHPLSSAPGSRRAKGG